MNILWQCPDGTLAVTILCPAHFADSAGAIPDAVQAAKDHAAELQARGDVPADWVSVAHNHQSLPHELPQEVWAWVDGQVALHVERAREWHRERLRTERAPKLADLDVQAQRALEEGRPTTEIVAAKQQLRDITQAVDQAQTWDELQAIQVP